MGRRKGVGGTERRYDWAYHVPRIINHISEGGLLAEYLRGENIPRHTFYTRLYNDRELYSVNGVLVTLMEGYRKAELIGIEAMIDDAVSIADREPRCYGADRRVDAGEVLWAEKRSAIRLKVAGMRNPEKYGNRVGIEHSGGIAHDVQVKGLSDEELASEIARLTATIVPMLALDGGVEDGGSESDEVGSGEALCLSSRG